MQEHVPEQLDMVTVLGRLAVGIGSAQDERAGVQAAVALPGLVERSAERAVGQVFQHRVAAEDGADGVPGGRLAEGPERSDLEQPVLIGTRLTVVAHVPDHVLRDPVSGPEHVAELELAQDRIPGPRRRPARHPAFEHALAFGGEVPVQIVNPGPWRGRALHRPVSWR